MCSQLQDLEQDPEEVTTIVRKALCAVARVHGRFGIQVASKLLRGTKDDRLQRAGLQETPTFGILKEHAEEWLLKLLRRCVTAGWVDFHGGERPVVVLTEEGSQVIHARRPARLLLPPTHQTEPRAKSQTKTTREATRMQKVENVVHVDEANFDEVLFEALRHYRMERARKEKVPPYVIASDRTLRDITLLRPSTLDELELAHGIGPAKAKKYGTDLLAVING